AAATPFVGGLSAVGQSVTYSLTVTNTGPLTLHLQNLSDTVLGNIVVDGVVQPAVSPVTIIDASGLRSDGSLAPGATLTIFVTRTVQATDADPTVSTVTWVFNEQSDFLGPQVTASATNTVDLATFAGFLDYVKSTGGVSNPGVANALAAKAKNATAAYEAGHYQAAKGMLGAFINQVEAQRGKFITESAADKLLQYVMLLPISPRSSRQTFCNRAREFSDWRVIPNPIFARTGLAGRPCHDWWGAGRHRTPANGSPGSPPP